MVTTELAHRLHAAGLRWEPRTGDTFEVREVPGERFTVSELTIEARRYPTGTILAFNGTTEWALDSVAVEDTLWIPREDQLRGLLGGTFVALTHGEGEYQVHVTDAVTGEENLHLAGDAATAYALALLDLLAAAGAGGDDEGGDRGSGADLDGPTA